MMFRCSWFAISVVSIYLLLYLVIFQLNVQFEVLLAMFLFSPFLVIWVVYTVLKYGTYTARELEGDEWGYEDKKGEDLGIF